MRQPVEKCDDPVRRSHPQNFELADVLGSSPAGPTAYEASGFNPSSVGMWNPTGRREASGGAQPAAGRGSNRAAPYRLSVRLVLSPSACAIQSCKSARDSAALAQHLPQPSRLAMVRATGRSARGRLRRNRRCGAPGARPANRDDHRCSGNDVAAQRLVLARVVADGRTLVGHVVRLTVNTAGDRDCVLPLSHGHPQRPVGAHCHICGLSPYLRHHLREE